MVGKRSVMYSLSGKSVYITRCRTNDPTAPLRVAIHFRHADFLSLLATDGRMTSQQRRPRDLEATKRLSIWHPMDAGNDKKSPKRHTRRRQRGLWL